MGKSITQYETLAIVLIQTINLIISNCPTVHTDRLFYVTPATLIYQHSVSPPQHLSTFIMDKTESIVTVDDAIKKLAVLDSKDKIWTQEMLLQVTDKAVRLLDCDTQVTAPHMVHINMHQTSHSRTMNMQYKLFMASLCYKLGALMSTTDPLLMWYNK